MWNCYRDNEYCKYDKRNDAAEVKVALSPEPQHPEITFVESASSDKESVLVDNYFFSPLA